ncbi:hypothetical protein [Arvimicrobium flavum]|uniref:hypothetical protein n=1 Tax=Arvimicrobium flavum TaxID=3393320 RepID=UPI00237B72B6|nr:hypothetical protein [Mesorhizobium shangrilense]
MRRIAAVRFAAGRAARRLFHPIDVIRSARAGMHGAAGVDMLRAQPLLDIVAVTSFRYRWAILALTGFAASGSDPHHGVEESAPL